VSGVVTSVTVLCLSLCLRLHLWCDMLCCIFFPLLCIELLPCKL
jgi:hypothetical protein